MYYIAPSYRGFKILKDDIVEDKKRYAIIDYKGKEKKIRLWDKPQKNWKDDGAPVEPMGAKSNSTFDIKEDGNKVYNVKGASFAEKYGFGEHGYIWFFEADEYGQSEIKKYFQKNGRKDVRRDSMLGLYTTAKIPPVIEGVTFVRINKEDVLIDDNTVKSDEEIKQIFGKLNHHPIHIISCGRIISKGD